MSDPKAPDMRPSVPSAILTVLGIVPFIGLLMLVYQVLGLGAPYFGFIFLLYWMAIQHLDFSQFVPSLAGGLSGIGIGWILLTVPGQYGTSGLSAALVLTATILFLYTRRQALIVINNSTMLYLAIAAIPELRITQNAPGYAASLLVGALYSAASVALGRWIASRRAKGAVSEG